MFEKMMLKQLLNTSIRAVPATSKNKKLNLFSILWDTGGILRKYSGSNATGKCVNPVKKKAPKSPTASLQFQRTGAHRKTCLHGTAVIGRSKTATIGCETSTLANHNARKENFIFWSTPSSTPFAATGDGAQGNVQALSFRRATLHRNMYQKAWYLERARRFERPTLTLARLCSTPELRPHQIHMGPESLSMERARRFERPTLTLARLCSTPELRPRR